ncbi:hypothetical protein WL40_10780 [Burkholderia ubonensis]|nr:hypothetical protein WL40_10780 [Burkholderia ubonensis]
MVRPLVHHFEQCLLLAYWDAPGKVWTCGWGSTGPDVGEGTAWTQDEADARCDADLIEAARHVDSAVQVPLTPHQKAALVSLVYNVGPGRATQDNRRGRDGIVRLASGQPSTLLRKLNAGDYASAADQFLVWNRAGGTVLRGLVRRRSAERSLFTNGTWDPRA